MDGTVTVAPAQGVIGFEHDLLRGVLAAWQGGARIGLIVDSGSDWLNGTKPTTTCYRVLDAGAGVPVPSETFATPEAAACAIVEARCVHQAWLVPGADGLTEFERRALAFELTPDAEAADGRREKAISELFGTHPTLYTARVASLLNERHAAAAAANPAAVAALDRRRARNRARRYRKPARGIGGRH